VIERRCAVAQRSSVIGSGSLDRLKSTLRARVRAWREPSWGLMSFLGAPRSYRLVIAVTMALQLLLLGVALRLADLPGLEVEVLFAGVGSALLLSLRVFAASDRESETPEAAIAIALTVAGHPLEGLICIAVTSVYKALRKPLVPHLVAANLLGGWTLVGVVAITQHFTAGHSFAIALGASIVGLTALDAANSVATALAVTRAQYATWSEATADLWLETRRNMLAGTPLALLIGAAIRAGGQPLLPLLLLPRFLTHAAIAHEHAAREARHAAEHDPLTGLPNRRALEVLVADGLPEGAWVLVCDLDRFKTLNDQHGHDEGDRALVKVAEQVRDAAHGRAICARIGGDEFTLFMQNPAPHDEAEALAQDIRHRVDATLGFLGVGCSVGYHRFRSDDTVALALRHADIAMYLAKRTGVGVLCSERADETATAVPQAPAVRLVVPTVTDERLEEATHEQRNQAFEYWTSTNSEDDPESAAMALYQRAWWTERVDDTHDMLQTTCEGFPETGWGARAGAAAALLEGDAARALELDDLATRRSRQAGIPLLEMLAMLGYSSSQRMAGDIEASIETLRRLFDLACLRDAHDVLDVAAPRLIAALECELELHSALGVAEEWREIALEGRREPSAWRASSAISRLAMQLGDIDRAVRVAAEGMTASDAVAPELTPSQLAIGLTDACTVFVVAGDRTQAHAALHAALSTGITDGPGTVFAWRLRAVHAELREVDGDRAGVRIALQRLIEDCEVWATAPHPFQDAACVVAAVDALTTGMRTAIMLGDDSVVTDIGRRLAAFDTSEHGRRLRTAAREASAIVVGAQLEELERASRRWRAQGAVAHYFAAKLAAAACAHGAAAADGVACAQDVHSGLLEIGAIGRAEQATRLLAVFAGDLGTRVVPERPLLAGLDDLARADLEAATSIATVPAGESLFDPEHATTDLIVVRKGLIRLSAAVSGQTEFVLALVGEGEICGESALVGRGASDTTAVCVVETVVERIPIAHLRRLMFKHPRLAENLLVRIGTRIEASEALSVRVATWPVIQRFAALLAELDDRFGHPRLVGGRLVNLRITGDELASCIGATRKAVTLVVQELREAGVLQKDGRRFVVLDRTALDLVADGGSLADFNRDAA
jgi:diguanylate cyclase (GGDEF)-like protein